MSDDLVARLREHIRAAVRPRFDELREAADEIARLRERIAVLEEALRFYVEPDKYTYCAEDVPELYSELDFGEIARAALAKGEAT